MTPLSKRKRKGQEENTVERFKIVETVLVVVLKHQERKTH